MQEQQSRSGTADARQRIVDAIDILSVFDGYGATIARLSHALDTLDYEEVTINSPTAHVASKTSPEG